MPDEPTRRERLETLRDMLCDLLSHPGIEPREIASLSKEYRAVLAELEAMPAPSEVSKSAALKSRVAAKWRTPTDGDSVA